jgi:protein involved in polysaccharide export with SLBB domain
MPLPALQKTEFQSFVEESSGQRLSLFGYNLFDSGVYTPVQNVPVPGDYVLGVGDEVQLRVWGSIDADLRLVIDRNGQVSIPKAGTLTLSGIKASELNNALRAQLSRYFNNFQVTASLGQLRSLPLFVVGQARKPGAYTLSSLSTLISALFESGGPAATGSLRNIQLIRDNKTIARLDLYKFITEGNTSADQRLLPGDVILIPPAGPRVALIGPLDNPAIYELAPGGEPLGRLLAYAGGTSAMTNSNKVLLERLQSGPGNQAPRTVEERALDANGLQTTLRDADVVTLLKLRSEFDNAVTLRGSVAQPLRHAFKPGMRISDLIPDRQALIDPIYYRRKNALVQFERVTDQGSQDPQWQDTRLDDKRQQDKRAQDYRPQDNRSPDSRSQDSRSPDNWQSDRLAFGTDSSRQVSLAQAADQFKNQFNEINWDYAVIERLDPATLRPKLISFDLNQAVVARNPLANLELKPGDVVTVFSVKDIPVPANRRSAFVRLGGEVNAPGLYQIQAGETLSQLLRRAGGISPNAYIYGTVFTRETTRKQQQSNLNQAVRRFESEMPGQSAALVQNSQDTDKATLLAQTQAAQRQMLAKLKTLEATGRISLEIDPLRPALPDMPLEDGDQITIPERSGFVSVFGAVLSETSFLQRNTASVRDYLLRAGMTRDADDSGVMVLRADGSVESNSGAWFAAVGGGLMSKPLYPGDAIFVPEKIDRRSGYVQFMTAAKDWTQLIYQMGIGAAALKTLRQ